MEYQIEPGIKGFGFCFLFMNTHYLCHSFCDFFELIGTLDFPQNSVGKIYRNYCK